MLTQERLLRAENKSALAMTLFIKKIESQHAEKISFPFIDRISPRWMQPDSKSNDKSPGIANGDNGGNPHATAASPNSRSIRDSDRHRITHTRFQFSRIAH
jgi:hypothetical protein